MKRTLLCALLAAAALSLPSAAYSVPVQVDGTRIQNGYLDDGSTFVPLRTLLGHLGDWDIHWDDASRTAVAASSRQRLTVSPKSQTVTVDDETYETTVKLQNGTTYVPLRLVAEALGNGVDWDPYMNGAAVTTAESPYHAVDLYWLSRVIYAESGAEPLEGQVAVGNVVLNRVASASFPNTIPQVVFDRTHAVQFEPVENGTIFNTPSDASILAAKAALDGQRPVGEAMYFYAPALSQGIWINANRPYFTTIGCHRFYL